MRFRRVFFSVVFAEKLFIALKRTGILEKIEFPLRQEWIAEKAYIRWSCLIYLPFKIHQGAYSILFRKLNRICRRNEFLMDIFREKLDRREREWMCRLHYIVVARIFSICCAIQFASQLARQSVGIWPLTRWGFRDFQGSAYDLWSQSS